MLQYLTTTQNKNPKEDHNLINKHSESLETYIQRILSLTKVLARFGVNLYVG